MFRLSKLADYATVLMACLSEDPSTQLSAQALAERTRLEAPTVSKLLKQLAQAELVHDEIEHREPFEIIAAIEGPLGMTECSIHAGLCDRENHCTVSSNLRKISNAVESALRAVTLADMAAPPLRWQPRVHVERLVVEA